MEIINMSVEFKVMEELKNKLCSINSDLHISFYIDRRKSTVGLTFDEKCIEWQIDVKDRERFVLKTYCISEKGIQRSDRAG